MKLCKDCKHYRRSWLSPFSGYYAECDRAYEVRVNLVTGRRERLRITDQLKYCENQRSSIYEGRCGEEGRLFEAKK